MRRTVYYISSQFQQSTLFTQSQNLFPFLTAPSIQMYSKSMIKFKKIHGICNVNNLNSVVPLPIPSKQFIFFGRSNVGKSTLLNRIMQQNVAAVSKRPGKTKQLLFCEVGPKTAVDSRVSQSKWYFVDCPGYGYATGVSKGQINKWGKLITNYLKLTHYNFINQRFFCLLDINQQLKQTDALVFQLLRSHKKSFTIIFTKCDKIQFTNNNKQFMSAIQTALIIKKKYKDMNYYTHFTSSRTLMGIDQLRKHVIFQILSDQL